MAHFKQINPLEANPSDKTPKSIDWTLCVLCQKSTQETLQCPANSKRKDVGVGYKFASLQRVKNGTFCYWLRSA